MMPGDIAVGEESAGEVPQISIPPSPSSTQTGSARIGDSTDDEEAARAFDVALVRRMRHQWARLLVYYNTASYLVVRSFPSRQHQIVLRARHAQAGFSPAATACCNC